jgi:SAM-dependent methyltransferase
MAEYVFDAAWEQERERLGNLEGWLDPGTIRCLEAIGIKPGWHCLEVGGGAGSIASYFSTRIGAEGRVVATDLDTRFLDALDLPNLEVRKHDIVNDTLEESAFDVIHSRLLLEHLPARDEVMKRLTAALKPGGWLLIEDFDWITYVTIDPSEEFERVRAAMLGVMGSAGYNAEFGRQIGPLLVELGFEHIQADGRLPMPELGNNPGIDMYRLTLTALRAPMVASGLCSDKDVDVVLEQIGDPMHWSMPPLLIAAWGQKPS